MNDPRSEALPAMMPAEPTRKVGRLNRTSRCREAIAKLFDDAGMLLDAKQKDYSPNANPFETFEKIAADEGITREQALRVLLRKHLGSAFRGSSTSEDIRGRFMDALNYLALLYVMQTGIADDGHS